MSESTQTVAQLKSKYNTAFQYLKTPRQRFLEKVNMNGKVMPHVPELGNCWEWLGAIKRDGYGAFWVNGYTIPAHRYSAEIYFGKIPENICILHKCDNRCCVNPGHIKPGTHKENTQDMVKKGRCNAATGARNKSVTRPDSVIKGDDCHFSKLTSTQILEIRYRVGIDSVKEMAKEYKVSQAQIRNIIVRRSWKHV